MEGVFRKGRRLTFERGGVDSLERIFPALLWLYLHFNDIKKGCQISFFQKMPPTKNALKVGEQDNCNID